MERRHLPSSISYTITQLLTFCTFRNNWTNLPDHAEMLKISMPCKNAAKYFHKHMPQKRKIIINEDFNAVISHGRQFSIFHRFENKCTVIRSSSLSGKGTCRLQNIGQMKIEHTFEQSDSYVMDSVYIITIKYLSYVS